MNRRPPLHRLIKPAAAAALSLALAITAFPQGKDYTDKDLSNRDLTGQDLAGSNFTDATCKNTKFDKANLAGANFTDADVSGATFLDADLTGANFQGAIFSSIYLSRANLAKANFQGARNLPISNVASLRGTNLRKATLSGSASGIDFREADLRGARLTDVYSLGEARMKRAKYDRATRFPADFDPEQSGLTLEEEEQPAAERPQRKPAAGADEEIATPAKKTPAAADQAETTTTTPATKAKTATKPNTAALAKAVERFLIMLDNGQYDESFDAASPEFRNGVTKAAWANNLKKNRESLGKPVDRSASKVDTKTDLETGKRTFVVPVTSKFTNGSVTEELTLVQDPDGEYRVADYSITRQF